MNATATEAAKPLAIPSAQDNAFSLAVRKARAITQSSLVPETYRGENNLGNAMIALEVAERTGASPLMVMQNLYVVHGRPSWSATFLIATVNACGRFSPLRFETDGGSDPAAPSYRVRAVAKDKDSGEPCEGPWITWAMVDAEGWSKKNGSKWKTMPALMFMYRAASFWTRVYAPELSLGIHTADEVEDIVQARTLPQRDDLAELQRKLEQRALGAPAADDGPLESFDSVKNAIEAAEDFDSLDEAANRVGAVENEAERAVLLELLAERRQALAGE